MELIKKYRLVIAVVLPIFILVIIRSTDTNHFKNDAKSRAELSLKQSNIITKEKAESLPGEKLIVFLDTDQGNIGEITGDALKIPADSVLVRKYFNTITKHNGPVLLFSSETAVCARVWMVLSQMGYRNIFILSDNSDNEVFKYKFRPDTLLP